MIYSIRCEKDAPLAQLVEQLTLNQWVRGSSPRRCTKKDIPRVVDTGYILFGIYLHDSEPPRCLRHRFTRAKTINDTNAPRCACGFRVPRRYGLDNLSASPSMPSASIYAHQNHKRYKCTAVRVWVQSSTPERRFKHFFK